MQRAGFFIRGIFIDRDRRIARAALPPLSAAAALAALLLGALAPAWAVPVSSLYVVIVPATDPAQVAQQAMRVELVRLTGQRSAASDPLLAGLVDGARQYVQLERATTSGQVQVLFDEPKLAAAIAATGVGLWDADRPLLWISLPPMDAAGREALRARLTEAAQERGLPISIAADTPTAAPPVPAAASPAPATVSPAAAAAGAAAGPSAAAPSAAVAPPPAAAPTTAAAATSATTLTGAAALQAAQAAGASAALVAVLPPSQPDTLQWTLSFANGGGQWLGSPELAIDQVADTLSAAARVINQSPVAQYACHITGVTDLSSLVSVLDAMQAVPGVMQINLSEVDGDQLTLQLGARGSGPELERLLGSGRLQPTGTGAEGLLEYRYIGAR